MKRQLSVKPTSQVDENGNLVITISLDPNEQEFLLNDLVSIEEWVEDSLSGKVSNSKDRMMQEWNSKLMDDPSVDVIYADEDRWLNMVVRRDDYKTRAEKEEESSIL